MELREYLTIKEKISNFQKQRDKSQGVLEQLLKKLNQEFKCTNLKEAEILLSNMQQNQDSEETKLQELMEEFQTKYGDKL